MYSEKTQSTESIFYYELHRKELIKALKQEYNLRFNDLLFLKHILDRQKKLIPLLEVKHGMNFSLIEIHKSFSTLTEMKIIGKQRCIDDERKVFITITSAQTKKALKLLEEFDALQKSILQDTKA